MAYAIRVPYNYFILKRYRFLTTAIFIGSASTVHMSLEMF